MSAALLDCKVVAQAVSESCRAEAEELKKRGITPKLGIFRVGEKGPDLSYEKGATRTMADAGIETQVFAYPADITQDDYITEFRKVNADPTIHGILAFRPLDNIDENVAIGKNLDAAKDVDASTADNTGKVLLGDPAGLYPCTAAAIVEVMDYYKDQIIEVRKAHDPSYELKEGGDYMTGLNVCIVNNSNVIGKPLACMLTNRFATVSIVHHLSKVEEKNALASGADVIVAAIPFRNTLTADMVKPGAVVIDASVIREKLFDADGNPVISEKTGKQKTGVFGCCTDEVAEKAAYITPVPGMGSVTSAMLAKNLIKACTLQNK